MLQIKYYLHIFRIFSIISLLHELLIFFSLFYCLMLNGLYHWPMIKIFILKFFNENFVNVLFKDEILNKNETFLSFMMN